MAAAVQFPGSNWFLGPPAGAENVVGMHTFTNGHCSVSCWELSAEEMVEVNRTGRIFISILSGRTQPAVFVAPESVMRGFLVDYGGTVQPGEPLPPALPRRAGAEPGQPGPSERVAVGIAAWPAC